MNSDERARQVVQQLINQSLLNTDDYTLYGLDQIRQIIDEAIQAAVKEEREACDDASN